MMLKDTLIAMKFGGVSINAMRMTLKGMLISIVGGY